MRFWVFLWALSACAQVTTGAISGYVLDPREEPVAQAEITLSRDDRGVLRSAFTDDSGFYSFAELAPAGYHICLLYTLTLPTKAEV
jgi:hypothetical protein